MIRSRAVWLVALGSLAAVRLSAQRQEWPTYGGDPGGMRYSPLADINRANVKELRPRWIWRPQERAYAPPVGRAARPGEFEATPIMVGDTLYLTTSYHRVVALNAATGKELWSYDPAAYLAGEPFGRLGFVHRGVAAWSDGRSRRIFLATRWRLIALDAATGRPVRAFGRDGEVDLADAIGWRGDKRHFGNTSPPTVYRDLVIVGNSVPDELTYPGDPPGAVVALDARTGRRRWIFRTIPADGEFGSDTWAKGTRVGAGHVNVWAPMTVDTARGLLYLPVGAASNDWYGGSRPGDNLFAEALVCLDAATGRRRWHFQTVHHGLWDYDLAAPPLLATVRHDGKPTDAVVVPTKTGLVYVFDRVTGEPFWPIEERPVPRSQVPGELSAPTQPVPTKPRPFARQGFTEEDVVDFTPELKRAVLDSLRSYRFGPMFSPPSLEGTLVMPGWAGGAPWGGGAYDPATQTLYVKANNFPTLARLVRPAWSSDSVNAEYVIDVQAMTVRVSITPRPTLLSRLRGRAPPKPLRIPVNKPPYGTLTAIDLSTGEHRWQVTVGDMPEVRNHPAFRDLKLPPLGARGNSGAIVTGGGLVFVSGGASRFHAFDRDSGKVLWDAELGEPGYGTPMTYRTRSGEQFVVIAVGQRDARLMAFALPRR